MSQPSPAGSRLPRYLELICAAVAVLATGISVYLAYVAREEHTKTIGLASQLEAKTRELVELREWERPISVTAQNAPVVSPSPSQWLDALKESARTSPSPLQPPNPRQVFRSPAIREMARQTGLRMLRPIYGPLLTQFNLSAEQRDRFYDLQLVVDNPGANLPKLPSEAESPEERAQIEAQLRQVRDSALSQIKDMFSQGEYQLYQSYLQTQSDRVLVEQFRQQVASSSVQMTDWQAAQLRDAVIQARAQYPVVGDDFAASDQAALERAAHVLTLDQLNAFRDYLHMQEEMRRELGKLYPPKS